MAPPCTVSVAAPGQIAQRPPGMNLKVQIAGERQILAGHGQQIDHRCVLHLGSGVDGRSVIESLPPPADAMRLQLTGGVNHRLAFAELSPALRR